MIESLSNQVNWGIGVPLRSVHVKYIVSPINGIAGVLVSCRLGPAIGGREREREDVVNISNSTMKCGQSFHIIKCKDSIHNRKT